jgi:ABC-2 type transport system permease protein
MSRVMTVVRKEYLERVRSKSFLIGTLVGPAFMALLVIGPALLADAAGDQERTVVVIDHTGETTPRLIAMLAEWGDDHVTVEALDCGAMDDQACLDELKARVLATDVDAGVVVPADFFARPSLVFYNTEVSAVMLREEALEPAFDRILREERFRRAGVDPSLQQELLARTNWQSRQLSAESETEQRPEVGIVGGIMMVMIIYMMLLTYGNQNLTVVIEEKGSRMVEVLLSSLRPEQLLLGKVVGIGLAALTQVTVGSLAGLAAAGSGVAVAGATIDLSLFGPWFWFNFLLFFLLGYFVYASLYAGVGAMCNSLQDSQQFSGTLTMAIIVPIMLMMFVIRAPDQPVSVVLSLVPFFAPILMFMRISVSNPPLWQVALSWLLLLVTIWWSIRMAGRLFRAGILLYGASPTWGSLVRAMRG